MPVSTKDLTALFGSALQAISSNQQMLNRLDGFNGDHGDHMAQNLRLVVEALKSQKSKPPAAALRQAAKTLQRRGSGGSGRDYAAGLAQAARELGAGDTQEPKDVVALLQAILASIPDHRAAGKAGNILEALLGGGSGGTGAEPGSDEGLDAADLLRAGLSAFQAQPSGADDTSTILRAALGALAGGGDPLGLGSARAASGGLIAQTFLRSLTGTR